MQNGKLSLSSMHFRLTKTSEIENEKDLTLNLSTMLFMGENRIGDL